MIVLNEQGTPQLNTVHHCRAEALLSALNTASVDLVVTSPPYDEGLRIYNGYSWNFEYIAQQTYRVLRPDGVAVWVVGDATINGSETLTSFKQAIYFRECGFAVETMIYQKNASSPNIHHPRYSQVFEYMFVLIKGEKPRVWNPIMRANSGGGKSVAKTKTQRDGSKGSYGGNYEVRQPMPIDNVWVFNTGTASGDDSLAFKHPAPFPESLAQRHIETWSNPGDLVLDYFGGSGTTATEAQRLGRRYLTNDISREYCDLMERRLAAPYTLPMFELMPA